LPGGEENSYFIPKRDLKKLIMAVKISPLGCAGCNPLAFDGGRVSLVIFGMGGVPLDGGLVSLVTLYAGCPPLDGGRVSLLTFEDGAPLDGGLVSFVTFCCGFCGVMAIMFTVLTEEVLFATVIGSVLVRLLVGEIDGLSGNAAWTAREKNAKINPNQSIREYAFIHSTFRI
jgi:hypothetical protein